MLGELAELGLMLARDLATQARAAEDTEEKVALVAAFQKTSRTVRLTLALDFKLERQAAQDAREVAREVACKAQAGAETAERRERPIVGALTDVSPAERQKRRVRGLMNRLLWTESEGDQEEYEILGDDLEARLDEVAYAPGFPDMPIEALVQRLADDMRLNGELVVTTAETMTSANTPPLPLADTG